MKRTILSQITKDWETLLHIGSVVLMLYLLISIGAYRIRNPERTETMIFLDLHRALLWRDPLSPTTIG